jgi:hypothetical protein
MDTGIASVGSLTRARVDAALAEASANADQGHNSSWCWRCTPHTIELRAAMPPLASPQHRELMLTLGALLFNLRVLIRGLAVHVAAQTMPDPTQPDLIAVLRPEGRRTVTAEDWALVDAILLPAPDGRLDLEETVTASLINRLRRAAKIEQAWLAQLPGGFRHLPATRDEHRRIGSKVGSDSELVVIGTVLDGAATRLQAGQALQRVLLTAAGGAVPARTVPSALRDARGRESVRDLIGGGVWPQAIVTLEGGHPDNPSAAVG